MGRDGERLGGLKLYVKEADFDTHAPHLAATTDAEGRFAFRFAPSPRNFTVERRLAGADSFERFDLEFTLSDSEQNEVARLREQVVRAQVVKLRLAVPAAGARQSTDDGDPGRLRDALGIELTGRALETLREHDITTLANIQSVGGIADRQQFARLEPTVLHRLDAYAHLSRVSPDFESNRKLIDKGYGDPVSIARKTRATFVAETHDILGDYGAAHVHARARAEREVMKDLSTGYLVERARGFQIPFKGPDDFNSLRPLGRAKSKLPASPAEEALDEIAVSCSCSECESAVSPAAYLADLLDYAIDHLRSVWEPISLQFLVDTFHQPFGDLPVDCKALDEKVRQVRIGIEVLRSYFKNHGPRTSETQVLQHAEWSYRMRAYQVLLGGAGVSLDELRIATHGTVAERTELALRLGVGATALISGSSHAIGDLLLDTQLGSGQPDALTEGQLERLFGLVDTTRDPLSDGLTLGTSAGQIRHWTLSGVEWRWNTSEDGFIFLTLKRDASGVTTIDLYRDEKRTQKVGTGVELSPPRPGVLAIKPEEESSLFGTVRMDYQSDTDQIQLVVVPLLECHRLRHLAEQWRKADNPEDAFVEGIVHAYLGTTPAATMPIPGIPISYNGETQSLAYIGVMDENQRQALLALATDTVWIRAIRRLYVDAQRPPLIDPDVIGPDDLRQPFPGNTPFDVWKRRRDWVTENCTLYVRKRSRRSREAQCRISPRCSIYVSAAHVCVGKRLDERFMAE